MAPARALVRAFAAAVARADAPCVASGAGMRATGGIGLADVRRASSRLTTTTTTTTTTTRPTRAYATTEDRGANAPAVDRYGTAAGPMAGLLRILREAPGLTTKELYERATAEDVATHSMRHMKGLLAKMKKIERVKTTPPVQSEGKRRGRGNFTYAITELGLRHVEKLDRATQPPKPL